MSKYGRPLRFGYSPSPTASDPMRPLRLAGLAETLGLDYVGIQDQSYSATNLEPWTLLTAIGMNTKSIALFAMLPEIPMNSPALWARAAASLDLLTNGRVQIGISTGTGASKNPFMRVGQEKRNETETLAELEEAIQLMRLMWSGEPSVDFNGKYWQLSEVQPGPAPMRRIGIWLGAHEADALALAGNLADGWVPNAYPVAQKGDLEKWGRQIDEAFESAGRDPSEVQRVWHINGKIGDALSNTPFHGTVEQWTEALAELAADIGIDTFLLVEGEDAEVQLEKFALEVVPRTRQLVEPEAGVAVSSGLLRAYEGAAASGPTQAEEKTDEVDWVDQTSMESFPASDPPGSTAFD